MKNTTERFPVSNEEYMALRSLFACMSVFTTFQERGIEKRMRKCGGWRWYRLAQVATDKAVDAFLRSVPLRKLATIQKDVADMKMDVYIDGIQGQRRHDRAFYVQEDVMSKIIEYACNSECTFCQKKKGDVKHCELRKALLSVVPWDVKTLDDDGHCKLSGEIHLFEADKELPFCETLEELEEEYNEL